MKVSRVVVWMAVVGGILGILTIAALFALSRMDFGENPENPDVEPEDFPDFDTSEPRLSRPAEHGIRATVIGVNDPASVPSLSYFMLLDDGRWAAGSTDNAGHTRPIYTDKRAGFVFYCGQEARDLWRSRHVGGGPVALMRSVDGGLKKRCSLVERSDSSGATVFQYDGW
jgi:hypothetical protein